MGEPEQRETKKCLLKGANMHESQIIAGIQHIDVLATGVISFQRHHI
jgi:hypothetical protein